MTTCRRRAVPLTHAARAPTLDTSATSLCPFRLESVMLYYAVVFLVVALVAAVFGFGGIAAGAAGIAKILFVLFLVLAVAAFIMNALRG